MIKCIKCFEEFPCREFYEYHWLEKHEDKNLEIKVAPKHVVDWVKADTLQRILNYMNKKKPKGSRHEPIK